MPKRGALCPELAVVVNRSTDDAQLARKFFIRELCQEQSGLEKVTAHLLATFLARFEVLVGIGEHSPECGHEAPSYGFVAIDTTIYFHTPYIRL